MPTSQLRAVRGFRVGRSGFGEITWLGETDVTNVNLDEVVSIEHGDVSIYSSETKPPVGTKLNKHAVIVLTRVEVPRAMTKEAFTAALSKSLRSAGASTIEYEPSDGILEFMVPHF
jgi:nuclear pore complex protein Nup98-Nup96